MRVTFVRTAGQRDQVYVARDDGSEASWEFPTYGDAPPHDLVHLVVEAGLAIAPGIYGRVAGGLDLARVNALANRTGGKDKYRVIGPDLADIFLSEAAAAAPWRDPEVDDAARLAAIRAGADAYGVEVPAAIDVAAVARTRTRLLEVSARWRALGAKGALVFDHPGATDAAPTPG